MLYVKKRLNQKVKKWKLKLKKRKNSKLIKSKK